MRTRLVVLGAGFGGLELTTLLSDAFGVQASLDAMARGLPDGELEGRLR